jgi:hypothetical protein
LGKAPGEIPPPSWPTNVRGKFTTPFAALALGGPARAAELTVNAAAGRRREAGREYTPGRTTTIPHSTEAGVAMPGRLTRLAALPTMTAPQQSVARKVDVGSLGEARNCRSSRAPHEEGGVTQERELRGNGASH